jgi:hypothetical protein
MTNSDALTESYGYASERDIIAREDDERTLT